MRKYVILLVLVGIIIFLNIKSDKEIRVRVIPYDNSIESLEEKEVVIGITKSFLEKMPMGCSYQNRIDYIKSHLEEFNDVLKSFSYYACLEKHKFPEKTYNGNVIKATECMTLLVMCENATGDNWWGSIYPELLSISSDEKVTYKSFIWEELISKS